MKKFITNCLCNIKILWWKLVTAKDRYLILILDERYKTPLDASEHIMQELREMGKVCKLKNAHVIEIDGKDYSVELVRATSYIPTQQVFLKQMKNGITKQD